MDPKETINDTVLIDKVRSVEKNEALTMSESFVVISSESDKILDSEKSVVSGDINVTESLGEVLKSHGDQINKLIDDMEILMKKSTEIEEASLISDMMYHLYRLFIDLNKDDNNIKSFIQVKQKFHSDQTFNKINVKAFQETIIDTSDPFSTKIKSKFNEIINKKSKEKLFSCENNSYIFQKIVEPRYNSCCRNIKKMSEYNSKKEFLTQFQVKIQNMILFKDEAQILFKQLQILLDDDELEEDLDWIYWIEESTKEKIPNGLYSLQDGIILCKLMNHFFPEQNVSFQSKKSEFKFKLNIANYLSAAEDIGIPMDKLFEIEDLFEKINLSKVRESIRELKKKVLNTAQKSEIIKDEKQNI